MTLEEISDQISRRYLKTLIEVNLELLKEVEPDSWEVEDIGERRTDEFLDWKSVENEL